MKAILVFKLPKERHEYNNATQGSAMRSILYQHLEYLRAELKHGDLNEEQYKAYKECQKHLIDLLIDEKIDVYE